MVAAPAVMTARRMVLVSLPAAPSPPTVVAATPTMWVLAPPADEGSIAAVSVAACPACNAEFNIRTLLAHINEKHVNADRPQCRAMVRARMAMLRKLEKPDVQLPPKRLSEGYRCRHCARSAALHATVDSLMKHICDDHPTVDADAEDVPPKTQSSAAAHKAMMDSEAFLSAKKTFPSFTVSRTGSKDAQQLGAAEANRLSQLAATPEAKVKLLQQQAEAVRARHPTEVPTLEVPVAAPPKLAPPTTTEKITVNIHAPTSLGDIPPAPRVDPPTLDAPVLDAPDLSACEASTPGEVVEGANADGDVEPALETDTEVAADAEVASPPLSASGAAPAPVTPDAARAVEFSDECFPCELCTKAFTTEGDLLRHLDTAHGDDIMEPGEGEEGHVAHAGVAELAAFVPSETAIAVQCDLCGGKQRVFQTELALYSHLTQKHPEVAAPADKLRELVAASTLTAGENMCPTCARSFPSTEALAGHVRRVHGAGETVVANHWWCNDCDKGFASAKRLLGHLQSKHQQPTLSLPCPGCRRTFGDMFSLKEHVAAAHPTHDASLYDDNEGYDCDLCPKRFLSSTAQSEHVRLKHAHLPRMR
jgi:uncharacterized C2H2 Zn-finger protein